MMEWETPHGGARRRLRSGFPHDACGHLKDRNDLRVLNVGHGLGIVRRFLRNYASGIAAHCVIEPHPDVLKRVDAFPESGRAFTLEAGDVAGVR